MASGADSKNACRTSLWPSGFAPPCDLGFLGDLIFFDFLELALRDRCLFLANVWLLQQVFQAYHCIGQVLLQPKRTAILGYDCCPTKTRFKKKDGRFDLDQGNRASA